MERKEHEQTFLNERILRSLSREKENAANTNYIIKEDAILRTKEE